MSDQKAASDEPTRNYLTPSEVADLGRFRTAFGSKQGEKLIDGYSAILPRSASRCSTTLGTGGDRTRQKSRGQ
jgi:hypothetical protein